MGRRPVAVHVVREGDNRFNAQARWASRTPRTALLQSGSAHGSHVATGGREPVASACTVLAIGDLRHVWKRGGSRRAGSPAGRRFGRVAIFPLDVNRNRAPAHLRSRVEWPAHGTQPEPAPKPSTSRWRRQAPSPTSLRPLRWAAKPPEPTPSAREGGRPHCAAITFGERRGGRASKRPKHPEVVRARERGGDGLAGAGGGAGLAVRGAVRGDLAGRRLRRSPSGSPTCCAICSPRGRCRARSCRRSPRRSPGTGGSGRSSWPTGC